MANYEAGHNMAAFSERLVDTVKTAQQSLKTNSNHRPTSFASGDQNQPQRAETMPTSTLQEKFEQHSTAPEHLD